MARLPPLPVMKSLTNRKAPLDELVVKKRRKVPNRVKAALERHHSYLRKNLRVDNELAAKLYGWIPKLLKST
jgi:hypothetical protein